MLTIPISIYCETAPRVNVREQYIFKIIIIIIINSAMYFFVGDWMRKKLSCRILCLKVLSRGWNGLDGLGLRKNYTWINAER